MSPAPTLPCAAEPGPVGVEPDRSRRWPAGPLERGDVDPVAAALPPADGYDFPTGAVPIETAHLDLFTDDARVEGTGHVLVKHDQEGAMLFVLRIAVDQRLLDQRTATAGLRRSHGHARPAQSRGRQADP